MSKIKIELNDAGIRELLKSPEVVAVLEAHADATISALGDGYTSEKREGSQRARIRITAETDKARRENLENNSILRALR